VKGEIYCNASQVQLASAAVTCHYDYWQLHKGECPAVLIVAARKTTALQVNLCTFHICFLKKLYKNGIFFLELLPVAREFQMPGHWLMR
jgi:hypothetical protein